MNSHPFTFEPDSPLWTINRELVLLLSGAKASILQICHPEVAFGVAAHSDFKRDGLGRLLRTLEAVYEIAFGTKEEAARMAEHVRRIHAKVRGSQPQPYNAFSQDAQMWVLATLITPGLEMYERYVEAVPPDWFPIYYRQMRHFGTFFGLDEGHGPQTWEEFSGYYEDMLRGDLLASDSLSADLARAIIELNGPLVFRLGLRPFRFLAEEFLESPLRERLGLRSRLSGRVAVKALDGLLPRLLPYLPKSWRYAPKYLKSCALLSSQASDNPSFSNHHQNQLINHESH